MAAGKIDCYFDCVSPYSYFAFVYLIKWRTALKSHGVDVEFIPMFLGGVMGGSGNKPPWTLKIRAQYLTYDRPRAQKYFGLPNMRTPEVFPVVTLLPQRALCYIKDSYSRDQYEGAMRELWIGVWEQSLDVSKPEVLTEVLQRRFSKVEAEAILKAAGEGQYKQKLSDNTKEALDHGAYGAPWFWVRNSKGQEQPFFGSDRFHYMFDYLGLPVSDIEVQEKAQL